MVNRSFLKLFFEPTHSTFFALSVIGCGQIIEKTGSILLASLALVVCVVIDQTIRDE